MLRTPRRRANVAPPWFRPDEPALAADAELRATLPAATRDARPVAAAAAASALIHALLALVAALAIGGSGAGAPPVPAVPLRATLATPPQKFAVPERPTPPPPAASADAPASPLPNAVLPLPIPAAPPAKVKGSGEGRVIVHVAEPDESPDPAVLAALQRAHPGAVRVVPEFETEPAGVYPQAALPARRQAIVPVVVVVQRDGRVELAPGTFDEPLFGASIREALAAARARPPDAGGTPVAGWALLRFYFEFVGADAAAAAESPR